MNFTLTEKLAIAKALDEIILADGEVKNGELAYLSQLSTVVGFDVELIRQSRNLSLPEAITALSGMTEEKKSVLALMMHEMAKADGDIDRKEMEVIISVFIAAGIDITKGKAT